MKKYLLGLFALVLAFSLSAFTTNDKTHNNTTMVYNWFDSDYDWFASSSTDVSPIPGCVSGGATCATGYIDDEVNTTFPGGIPDISYKEHTK